MDHKRILMLSANPHDTNRIRFDEEDRRILEGLERSRNRSRLSMELRVAVRPFDIHRALLDHSPQIVSFSGHSTGSSGILLEDDSGQSYAVTAEALSGLFELFPLVECILLNSCYTEEHAKIISKSVGYTIGMRSEIDDEAAIAYSVAFFDAIGAGRYYDDAHRIGCSLMRIYGVSDEQHPNIFINTERIEQTQKDSQRLLDISQSEDVRRFNAQIIQQNRQARKDAWNYARTIVDELMTRLCNLPATANLSMMPDLTGTWHGTVNGVDQLILIKQRCSVVSLKGFVNSDAESEEHVFTGEGRVIANLLVFGWYYIQTQDKGINLMSLSKDANTLDGRFFTAVEGNSNEVYERV